MKAIKILSLVMALLLTLTALVSCKKQKIDLSDAVAREDFTSVYDKIGSKVTIDMVTEDENGFAFVTVDGKKYELGMDFLSMAMVYNTQVPAGSTKYKTQEDVFNQWWKLYIQRWNYLAPEVPLYSNQYFDLYNAKIQNFVTTPYWTVEKALVAATLSSGDSIVVGDSTDLSGAFRNAGWGKASPGASDLAVQNLTSGYETVETGKDGSYHYNMKVLDGEPVKVINDDGTVTFTVKIQSGKVFSDGSAITAKHYIASILANSTAVSQAAGATGNAGLQIEGFAAFAKSANGKDADGKKVYFSGVKLIDDNTFTVTYSADYANYYYGIMLVDFAPSPLALYLGSTGDVVVDPETKACGLNDAFYEMTGEGDAKTYARAAEIKANLKWNSALPYSGPYIVKNYNESSRIATLELNDKYEGDIRGKATIKTITYIKVEQETQLNKFKAGEVDVLGGITGATETEAALNAVKEKPAEYKETHYDRAGYGKLGFRCDFGPTMFTSVRQAIMYTLNRNEFSQTFTGGFGSVVHGPYYEGYSAFKAVKDEIKLNPYTFSVDSAIEVLKKDGWIYNAKGKEFNAGKDTVRYRKLSGYELTAANLEFKSTDGKYRTVKIDGEYYMPLCINYYGTQPNSVTDLLLTAWANADAPKQIGMYVVYTSTDFNTGLYAELSHGEGAGWDGVWKLNAINFATGFTSAAYDYSFNWSANPNFYDTYSMAYLMDEADFWSTYQ